MKTNIITCLTILLVFFSCSKKNSSSCCSKSEGADAEVSFSEDISELSLYNLESEWVTQDDQILHLEDLKGKAQIMVMIYTKCAYACPRLIADLKRVEEEIQDISSSDLGIVLVSMDPENDTPAQMTEYSKRNKLSDRYMLITSTEHNILELSHLLNVKFKKEGDDYAHSNILTLLDAQGEIVFQQEGLGEDITKLVSHIRKLSL
ncbi:SCO family protein [Cytophagaceae bacterium ABcell3]|nr:SCO family protein [Cytophagaceae bacterium ABcell3]